MGAPKKEAKTEMKDVLEFMSSFFNLTKTYFLSDFDLDNDNHDDGKASRKRELRERSVIPGPTFEKIGEFRVNYPEVTLLALTQAL